MLQRRLRVCVTVLIGAVLVACGGPPSGQAMNPPITSLHKVTRCSGTRGVRVMPCPVMLTASNGTAGVVVTVSGVNVKFSSLYSGKCKPFCKLSQYGSSGLQWELTSGAKCGGTELVFAAGPDTGPEGYGHLKVVNDYCP